MPTNHEYIYGEENENFSFFRIPRALVKNERFRDLSTDSKLLYGLMLDRMGLSLQNGWQNTEGRAFIYFTLEEIQATLSCGHNKAVHLMVELEQYNLIERVKQGQGKPAKIYIKKIDADDADEQTSGQPPKPADLQTSEKSTCRLPVSKRLDFPKGDGNYTDKNYTDKNYTEFSYINPSINPNHPRPTSTPPENQLPTTDAPHRDSAAHGAVQASMSCVKHTTLVGGEAPPSPHETTEDVP